jgi:hypothetical protein
MISRRVSLLLLITAISACQSGWVGLDGKSSGSDELKQARTICAVDEKLAQLELSHSTDSAQPDAINSNEARMLRSEDIEMEKRRVYREIEICMRQQGLQPGA